MRLRVLLLGLILVPLVVGCMSYQVPPYSPSYEFIDGLKGKNLEKIAVSEVQPRDPNSPVNRITLRGSWLLVQDGTFATYFESALKSDLNEIGIFDQNSTIRLDAKILKNDIDVSGFSTGIGTIDINITIRRDGKSTFDKLYSAQTTFQSSFAGAVAVPKGQNEYPVLVRTLLEKIFADPEFFNAIKK